MKKIISMMMAVLLLSVSSCKKDDNNKGEDATPKTTEIKLSVPSPVDVSIDAPKEVTLSGGDGKNYAIEVSDDTKITAHVVGNKLTITPKSDGSATIKIKSADKVTELVVNVLVPEITLSETSPLEIQTRETKEVTLTGGNGTSYSVQSSNQEVVKATIESGKLTLFGVSQGEAKITISSAGKQTELDVKVLFQPTRNGIYDLEGNTILESTYNAGVGDKVSIFRSGAERHTGPMLRINYINRPTLGTELELTIFNSRGLPSDFAPNTIIRGKVIGVNLVKFQIQTEKYILTLPCKL